MPTNQSREDPEGGKLRKSNARGHPSYDTVRNTRFTEALPENCVEVPADLPDACSRFATLRGRNPISSQFDLSRMRDHRSGRVRAQALERCIGQALAADPTSS